ncbi:hypothetical protein QR98_0098650 [Sarcoptes scabiei]|uniref:Uncharacterized protein n=1 Tax=Sarcoptes scabiei TaxID=52283 RepID=A0A132AL41_SARSC|nr:hypothetical protein QR98_0098650 [Sarcoptes scabiei]
MKRIAETSALNFFTICRNFRMVSLGDVVDDDDAVATAVDELIDDGEGEEEEEENDDTVPVMFENFGAVFEIKLN